MSKICPNFLLLIQILAIFLTDTQVYVRNRFILHQQKFKTLLFTSNCNCEYYYLNWICKQNRMFPAFYDRSFSNLLLQRSNWFLEYFPFKIPPRTAILYISFSSLSRIIPRILRGSPLPLSTKGTEIVIPLIIALISERWHNYHST